MSHVMLNRLTLLCLINICLVVVTKSAFLKSESIFKKQSNVLMSNFTSLLIQEKYSLCTILNVVVQEHQLKYENLSNSHIDLLTSLISNPQFIFEFNSENLSKQRVLTNKLLKPKLGQRCVLSVIYLPINNFTSATSLLLLNIKTFIFPNFLQLARKDEDLFIFLSPAETHTELLTTDFSLKIKFKIAVGFHNRIRSVIISNINVFTGPNNPPKLSQHIISHNSTLSSPKIDYFPDYLWNLNGALLRITIPNIKSMVEADPSAYFNNGKRGRWLYLLEEYLIPKFNFSYHMFLSTGGGGSGSMLRNGTWIGIQGDLVYGRADMGFHISNTDKRVKMVGFTNTFFYSGYLTFVTTRPSNFLTPFSILWPFRKSLWIIFILICIGGFIFITFMKNIIFRHLHSRNIMLGTGDVIELLLKPFLDQSYASEPPSFVSFQIFLSFWSLFAMVTSNLYKCRFVSLLAIPVLIEVPDTFSELAFSQYRISLLRQSDVLMSVLTASNDPVYESILDKMEVFNGKTERELKCLKKVVKEDKYACLTYDFDLTYFIERNFTKDEARKFCTPTNIQGRTFNIFESIATEAYSIYRQKFAKVLGNTMPFHLANVWNEMDMEKNIREPKRQWWRETNQTEKLHNNNVYTGGEINENGNEEGNDGDNDVLRLENISGVFCILVGNAVLSFFVLICEVVWQSCVQRRQLPRIRNVVPQKPTDPIIILENFHK